MVEQHRDEFHSSSSLQPRRKFNENVFVQVKVNFQRTPVALHRITDSINYKIKNSNFLF